MIWHNFKEILNTEELSAGTKRLMDVLFGCAFWLWRDHKQTSASGRLIKIATARRLVWPKACLDFRGYQGK